MQTQWRLLQTAARIIYTTLIYMVLHVCASSYKQQIGVLEKNNTNTANFPWKEDWQIYGIDSSMSFNIVINGTDTLSKYVKYKKPQYVVFYKDIVTVPDWNLRFMTREQHTMRNMRQSYNYYLDEVSTQCHNYFTADMEAKTSASIAISLCGSLPAFVMYDTNYFTSMSLVCAFCQNSYVHSYFESTWNKVKIELVMQSNAIKDYNVNLQIEVIVQKLRRSDKTSKHLEKKAEKCNFRCDENRISCQPWSNVCNQKVDCAGSMQDENPMLCNSIHLDELVNQSQDRKGRLVQVAVISASILTAIIIIVCLILWAYARARKRRRKKGECATLKSNRRQENARLQKMRVDISLTSLPEPSLNNSTAMVYSPVIVPRVHLSAASQPIDIIKYKQAMEVDITKLEYPIQVAPIPLRFSNRNAPIPSATSVDVPPNREILPRAGIRVGH